MIQHQKLNNIANLNIIHSSGNLGKDARSVIKNNSKKHDYELITIYFNLPKSVVHKRIMATQKNTKSLWRSKNWHQVMENQEKYAELPPSKQNTIYFEI